MYCYVDLENTAKTCMTSCITAFVYIFLTVIFPTGTLTVALLNVQNLYFRRNKEKHTSMLPKWWCVECVRGASSTGGSADTRWLPDTPVRVVLKSVNGDLYISINDLLYMIWSSEGLLLLLCFSVWLESPSTPFLQFSLLEAGFCCRV